VTFVLVKILGYNLHDGKSYLAKGRLAGSYFITVDGLRFSRKTGFVDRRQTGWKIDPGDMVKVALTDDHF
jgi:hypothetical protein